VRTSRLLTAQLVLVATGVVLLALVWLDSASALRPLLTLVFLTAGPGAALAGLFRLEEAWMTTSLAIALSLVVDVVVAQAMVWTGTWSPGGGLLVILLVTVMALAGQVFLDTRGFAAQQTARRRL
jgi:hypothetical protein